MFMVILITTTASGLRGNSRACLLLFTDYKPLMPKAHSSVYLFRVT